MVWISGVFGGQCCCSFLGASIPRSVFFIQILKIFKILSVVLSVEKESLLSFEGEVLMHGMQEVDSGRLSRRV